MARECKRSPFIDNIFYITQFPHAGGSMAIDLATTRANPNRDMYNCAIHDCKVILNGWDGDGYGHYIKLKDVVDGTTHLYAHMEFKSPLAVGSTVKPLQYIGKER